VAKLIFQADHIQIPGAPGINTFRLSRDSNYEGNPLARHPNQDTYMQKSPVIVVFFNIWLAPSFLTSGVAPICYRANNSVGV